MGLFADQLSSVYRQLQTFDTALGIHVQEKEVVMVQTRKLLKGFRVLNTHAFHIKEDDPFEEIIPRIIRENQLSSTYIVIGVPRQGVLIKRISIPLMDRGQIQDFLYQNTGLFMPANVELDNLNIRFRITLREDAKLHLLVLVYRRRVIEEYISSLGIPTPFQILYNGFGLDSLMSVIGSEFNGIVLEVNDSEVFWLFYRSGKLVEFQSAEQSELSSSDVSSGLSEAIVTQFQQTWDQEEPVNYLVCGNSENSRLAVEILHKNGLTSLRQKLHLNDPNFIEAFSLSISAFANAQNDFDLQSDNSQSRASQYYYRQLTIKSILFLGILTIIGALLLYTTQTALQWQYNRYESAFSSILPLSRARDSLFTARISLINNRDSFLDLTRQTTRTAFYLYKISGALPKQVWLHRIRIAEENKAGLVIQLDGVALEESRVAQFLKELEEMPFARNIVLDEMTVLNQKEIFRRWKLRYQKLIEFRMRFNG